MCPPPFAGRSRELYTVAASTGASGPNDDLAQGVAARDEAQVPAALTSFSGEQTGTGGGEGPR